jgi:hypothetical protein
VEKAELSGGIGDWRRWGSDEDLVEGVPEIVWEFA